MKKFTLLFVAFIMATMSSFARANNRIVPAVDGVAVRQQMQQGNNRLSGRLQSRKASQPSLYKAPRRAAYGISIEDQPDGKLVENLQYSFNGIAYSWFSGFYDSSSDASPFTLVEGSDGNLYLSGLTPNLGCNEIYWIKAEKVADGEYVVKKQPAGFWTNYDEVDYLTILVPTEDGSSYVEAETTEMKLTYKDGVLAQADPTVVYGIVYEEEGEWAWEGESYWGMKVAPMTETYTTLPEGAVAETYVLQFASGAQSVQLAFVGDKVYVQSYPNTPGWYVGTISGDKVTFVSGQFLGLDEEYNSFQWLMAATTQEVWDEEYEEYYTEAALAEQLVFDYDAEAHTLTAPENTALLINGSKSRVYYAAMYKNPRFFIFNEVAATPADPIISKFWPYEADYESAELDFIVPLEDVDGNYISPDKLSYKIYVDDEPFTFEQDEYVTLARDYDELPYNFTDEEGWIGASYLCLFFDPAKNIGIQSIYRGAGEERVSNIVYYDIATEEIYTVDKNGNIVDAIQCIGDAEVSQTGAQAIRYYDVTGRLASRNTRGLLLKTTTKADGSQKTVKVIQK